MLVQPLNTENRPLDGLRDAHENDENSPSEHEYDDRTDAALQSLVTQCSCSAGRHLR